LALLTIFGPGLQAQTNLGLSPYQGQSQLWFDASGTDEGAFGPNEIITVSGNLTYIPYCGGYHGGINDSFASTSAALYVVRHGDCYYKLTDVRPGGNPSVISSEFSGASFIEQVLAITGPQGALGSGNYDVVINECENGFWDSAIDLRLGGFGNGPAALNVFIPADVEDLPFNAEIGLLKYSALDQEQQWKKNLVNEGVFFTVADVGLIEFTLINKGANTAGTLAGFGVLLTVEKGVAYATANLALGYARIAADPPDPAYQQLVTLSPITPLAVTATDPLLRLAGAQANAIQQEGNLAGALLAALEKYQGAEASQDGYWALAHAREIQEFSFLLGGQLARTQTATSAFRNALATNAATFDQEVASAQVFQTRIQNQGFNTSEEKELLGLGYDSAGIASLQSQIAQTNYNLTSGQFLSELDALSTSEAGAIASYTNLALAMNEIITNLTAQSSLDLSQPIAVAGGPYVGTIGAPITFDASGSSDPYGTSLAFSWDLNGDAAFDDATGAVTSVTFQVPFSGYIGVDITNQGGNEAIAYTYLTVTDPKPSPVFATLSPTNTSLIVAPSNSLQFQATATEPDGDAVTIQWLLDGQVVGTDATYTYQPVDADVGPHVVEARASAGLAGAEVTTFDWVVAVARAISLADVSVTQTDSSDPVLTGNNVTYAVTVQNNGPDAAAGVTLTDVIPAGASFVTATASQGTAAQNAGVVTASLGSLAAGASALVNITLSPAMSGTLSNWATVSASALDLNTNDNTSWELTRVNDPSSNNADLSVSLAGAPLMFGSVGIPYYYYLMVQNLGPDMITGGVLVATLPPGWVFSYANVVPDLINGNILSFDLAQLGPGGSTAFLIGAIPPNTGTFTTTISVSANETDTNLSNNFLTENATILAHPPAFTDWSIGQTIAPNPVTISNQVTITLTASNLGPNDATGATILDSLPAGLTFISATPAPNVISGQFVSFNTGPITNGGAATVVIQALPVEAGTLANIATVTAADNDTNAGNNESRVELVVNATPVAQSDLAVSLDSSTNQVNLGSNVTITATVLNLGPNAATNTSLTEAIPAGLSVVTTSSSMGTVAAASGTISASLGTLASGTSATVTFTGTPTMGRPLVIVATGTSGNNDPDPTNNIASITVVGWNPLATVAIDENFPALEIDALEGYLAEMNLPAQIFDHSATKPGFAQLQGYALIIWDDLSYAYNGIYPIDVDTFSQAYTNGSHLYFIGDDLAYTADWALSGTPEFDVWISLIHLQATETNAAGDGMMEIVDTNNPVTDGMFGLVGNSIYNGDPDGTTVTGTGEVLLGISGPGCDVLLSYEDPVTQNRTVTQNECAFDSTDANGIAQRKILFKNAVAWLLGPTNLPTLPTTDLSVAESTAQASVSVDGDLIYTVSVTNYGPDVASGITLTDVLPINATFVAAQLSQGTWSLNSNILTVSFGSLVSNGIAILALHITAGPQGELTNLVSVLGNETDPNTNNNQAVSLLMVEPIGSPGSVAKADVSVSQMAPTNVVLGQLVTYSLTASNAGPYAATNVTLSDTLPVGAIFVGAQSSQGTIVNTSNTVNVALGVLTNGGSATVSIVVNLAAVDTYTNSALVDSDIIDPNTGNNASLWVTSVPTPPATTDLLVDVRVSPAAVPVGSNVTFTLLAVNNGPDGSADVQCTLPLPPGMVFVSASAGATPAAGTLSFDLGPLAAGTTASATAILQTTVPGNVVIVASAVSAEGGTNSASVTLDVLQPTTLVDLAVFSSVNDTYVPVGDKLIYTIVVANNSPTVATGVIVSNKLPASASFISATGATIVSQTNGIVVMNLGSVTNNFPVTLVIEAMPSQPDVLVNRTSVNSEEVDSNPGDNATYVLALSEVLITSVSQLAANLGVSFETSLGKNYVIQSQSDLTRQQWVTIAGTQTAGTGHIMQVILAGAFTESHQYYRVVLTQ
jgi:uncharacterized repeat protein (TIGR01451 family)